MTLSCLQWSFQQVKTFVNAYIDPVIVSFGPLITSGKKVMFHPGFLSVCCLFVCQLHVKTTHRRGIFWRRIPHKTSGVIRICIDEGLRSLNAPIVQVLNMRCILEAALSFIV